MNIAARHEISNNDDELLKIFLVCVALLLNKYQKRCFKAAFNGAVVEIQLAVNTGSFNMF